MPFQFRPYESQHAGSIGEIMARQGQARAHAVRQRGLARANTIGTLGQAGQHFVGNLGQIMQAQRDAPMLAEDRELRVRKQRADIAKIEHDIMASQADEQQAAIAQDAVRKAMSAAGGDKAKAADILLNEGWHELAKNIRGQVPPPAEPYTLAPGASRFGPDNQPVASVPSNPPAPPPGFNLSPGQTRFGSDGKPIASLPPAPERERTNTLTPNMESQVINRLSNQWTAASKPARELERQVSIMEEGLKAAQAGNLAQGGQTILVTFQKILDPTSVVRESEFDRSREGQALMDRARGAYERLTKGGPGVPYPELVKYAELAKQIAIAQRGSRLEAIQERLGKTADRFKIPRELVFEADPTPEAQAAPVVEEWVRDANGRLVKKAR